MLPYKKSHFFCPFFPTPKNGNFWPNLAKFRLFSGFRQFWPFLAKFGQILEFWQKTASQGPPRDPPRPPSRGPPRGVLGRSPEALCLCYVTPGSQRPPTLGLPPRPPAVLGPLCTLTPKNSPFRSQNRYGLPVFRVFFRGK